MPESVELVERVYSFSNTRALVLRVVQRPAEDLGPGVTFPSLAAHERAAKLTWLTLTPREAACPKVHNASFPARSLRTTVRSHLEPRDLGQVPLGLTRYRACVMDLQPSAPQARQKNPLGNSP